MAGTMTDRRSVAANATEANVISGKTMEFISERSVVRLYATAAAIGLFCTLIVGTEVTLEDQELNAQNRMPILPDDFVAAAGALPGDRIVVKLRNSTGAAIVGFTRVEVSPA
jgi:hypothetical protein